MRSNFSLRDVCPAANHRGGVFLFHAFHDLLRANLLFLHANLYADPNTSHSPIFPSSFSAAHRVSVCVRAVCCDNPAVNLPKHEEPLKEQGEPMAHCSHWLCTSVLRMDGTSNHGKRRYQYSLQAQHRRLFRGQLQREEARQRCTQGY